MLEACKLKRENQDLTTLEIVNKLKLGRSTIIRYLKTGNKLGLCHYDVKEESFKRSSKVGKLKCKQVEIFKDGISLGIFESCTKLVEMSEELFDTKLISSSISQCIYGKRKSHKGFTFKYIE